MPIQTMKHYTRAIIQKSPDKLFVFGDNCHRVGMGGQAGAARGERNAVGIRTKNDPGASNLSYFRDMDYQLNLEMIMTDMRIIFIALRKGRTVVWPADGIGTGLAKLPETAPLTLAFIEHMATSLKTLYGTVEE